MTEEDDAAVQTLLKHTGVDPKEYHVKVLRKVMLFASLLPA